MFGNLVAIFIENFHAETFLHLVGIVFTMLQLQLQKKKKKKRNNNNVSNIIISVKLENLLNYASNRNIVEIVCWI